MDPYRRLTRREVYRNPWVAVEVHEIVHPTGTPGEHVLFVSPAPSGVLVIDGEEVIFAEQPRFGARATGMEIVKGGAEDGETALACAQRELREELGYVAERWSSLGYTYEIPSIVDKPVELFLARDLRSVEADPENVERIERLRLPLTDAYAAIADGRINDAATIVALARYRALTDATGS